MLVANLLFGPLFSPLFGRKIMLLNRHPVLWRERLELRDAGGEGREPPRECQEELGEVLSGERIALAAMEEKQLVREFWWQRFGFSYELVENGGDRRNGC